ncbi:MAG: glycosyltransferase family 39 protein [Kiritimatiellae bacterium]|nr:glycosyltransferase family 39 protein [Kiritimatiellia bacterium]
MTLRRSATATGAAVSSTWRHWPFWALTAAYGGALMLPKLLSEGTFLDGEIYAVLARNLAEGQGSFWRPYFSPTDPVWAEHPPLGLNIASLFYRALGDGAWVEHVYSFVTALVCGWLIVVAWQRATGGSRQLRELRWLPLLFWLLNPQVTWAYANNMLENTMTIFTLLAVLALLRACRDRGPWLLSLVLGAAAMVAAALTKGIVGLFPAATFAAYQLATRRLGWGRTAARTVLLAAAVTTLIALVLAIPAARSNLALYLDTQFLTSLSGQRGGTDNQFRFLVKLLNTLLPALGAAGVIWLTGRRGRGQDAAAPDLRRWALVFLLLGMAGSIPLVFSPRQSMFYVLPSFPCYALAFALWVAPAAAELVARVHERPGALRAWQTIAGLLLAAVLVYSASRIGTYNRSEAAIRDVKAIGAFVQAELGLDRTQPYEIGMCRGLWTQWGLHTNLARYSRLGAARNDSTMAFVVAQDRCAADLDGRYARVPIATREFHLYTRSDDSAGAGQAPR